MTDTTRPAALLAAARFVLLDFDGPVCDVYAGRPASRVADELRRHLAGDLTGPLPDPVADTEDPLVVLRAVADFAPRLAAGVEAALQAAELHAVTTAAPTPGAADFLAACHRGGRPVAIVSNNTARAVAAYLRRHRLDRYVRHIEGRDPRDPRRMKPSTFLLHQAVTALSAGPATVFIGDSSTDVDAAHAYGIRAIGYANKPAKLDDLGHADALVTDMAALIPGRARAAGA